jgi:hypothetical protein
MTDFTGPFFELKLADADGRQIAPQRFRNV